MIKNVFLAILFLLGLTYLLLPGPSSVKDIAALPNSVKSSEPGDTIQVPNVAAYFSDMRRKEVTSFYLKEFSYLKIGGITIPPLSFVLALLLVNGP